jgi:hypothetical protein
LNPEFDLDDDETVKLQPISEFRVEPVATIAVMLQIEYLPFQGALETGDRERKQFVLFPRDALNLAEKLKRVAEPLLGPLPLGDLNR